MTDNEIMSLFDQANTPCTITTAHSEWHKTILLRFSRALLAAATTHYSYCRHCKDGATPCNNGCNAAPDAQPTEPGARKNCMDCGTMCDRSTTFLCGSDYELWTPE